jgi:hypothetical protein
MSLLDKPASMTRLAWAKAVVILVFVWSNYMLLLVMQGSSAVWS